MAATMDTPDRSSETSSGSTPSLDAETQGKVKPAGNVGNTRKLNLKMSFKTLSRSKTTEKIHQVASDKNEPSRFLGEGVSFKAKLIGILEVSEARGDRMCQEALADLKMAIRAAGEHKQRITINIAIDGLRLRDEKNGDCLYHHPVHKISFIAQDMSDSRAFGYIFGSPDTGHRFFGIKTDKAASQVVIAMRDLFQVVFELKKKEIEMAKQHIELHQIKISEKIFMDLGSSLKNGVSSSEQVGSKTPRVTRDDSIRENGNASATAASTNKTSEVIADLLDLEFELNSIQQGIHQMERITPSDPFGPSSTKTASTSDPFGDSFTPTTTIPPPPRTIKQSVPILPPPPVVKEQSPLMSDPFNVPPPSRQPHRRGGVRGRTAAAERFNTAVSNANKPEPAITTPVKPQQEKHWFDRETESLFGEGELVSPPFITNAPISTFVSLTEPIGQEMNRSSPIQQTGQFDVFTDLDPLGTGRSKPYIDRKDFFQDLKNPPKKVLKDLATEAPSEATAPLFQATFEAGSNHLASASDAATNTSIGSNSSITTSDATAFPRAQAMLESDPFNEDDPFYRADPFESPDVSNRAAFPSMKSNADPFDTGFADFTMFGSGRKSNMSEKSQDPSLKRVSPLPQSDASQSVFSPRTNFHGPLRVSLPPEKSGASSDDVEPLPSYPQSNRQTTPRTSSSSASSKQRTKSRLYKQNTLSGMPKLPSPKSSQRSNRLAKQMTVDSCTSKSQSLHPNATPLTPPTPQRYDRRSPASHLESVTLRNRCAITPSPPIVACFPDADDNNTRTSAEFSEIAPEPPPRPASIIALIKPPPLPPKRQQAGNTMRPPPRPPHTDDQPHYDYIENYETSSSPMPNDTEELKSPPIPVPARRPRFSLDDVAPQRPRRHHPVVATLSNKSSDDDYLTPISFPLLPPPQKRNQETCTAMSQSPVATGVSTLLPTNKPETNSGQAFSTPTSLNLTLSQLTKTGFADLATTLGMSPGQLSNMTLQELTECLAKLSSNSCSTNAVDENIENNEQLLKEDKEDIKREKYATLRESVDEEPMFKAEFENNFSDVGSLEKPSEDVFQETLFDKYAVFRELISDEKTDELQEESQVVESDILENGMDESNVLESQIETVVDDNTAAMTKEAGDRYAALRDISLNEDTDAMSDKEQYAVDTARADDEVEEEDLLTLSRQQSESTESPTMETATMREPQSIMETTIYEEDISALEADNDEGIDDVPDILEDVEEEETEQESPIPSEHKENIDSCQPIEEKLRHSSSSEKDETKGFPIESTAHIEDINALNAAQSWAKFDSTVFPLEKPTTEVLSEEVASPWSSEGKEFGKSQSPAWQHTFDQEHDRSRQRRKQRTSPWQEEESEEGGRERRTAESAWRENGWSDGESYYEDVPRIQERAFHEDRRGRRRRVSPWKKGQRSSRDASPWEHGRYQDHSVDDEEEDEEYEAYWKTRPKHRGTSWDDERRRRFEHRDVNGIEYEESRKRRPSPWSGEDRRSSRESVNWDEEERFSQRDFPDRRTRDREEDYRRRREQEVDVRGYFWQGDYRHEQTRRSQDGVRRHYRDRSHESPWEDEYSEQGDDDSPQYQKSKRNWSIKRPSSSSESRRTSDRSPGEFKNRSLDKPQYSLPVAPRAEREPVEKMGVSERRYRDKCGGRPHSRDGHFNSDQEYDYWPPERVRRESGGYEQRSQTLHTKRPNKYKKAQERSYSQKSPFDDDFLSHPLSVSSSDIIKNQGGESDASDNFKKKSPLNPAGLFSYTDSFPRRRDQYSDDIRPTDIVPSSPLDPGDSSLEEMGRTRSLRGSCNRQSPFEDDFTPPETRPTSCRRVSSVSSDVSDQRRSPYDDIRGSRRVPSVAEEIECDKDLVENKNGKINDDVFLPEDNIIDPASDKRFADFDNGIFANSSRIEEKEITTNKTSADKRTDRRILRSGEDGKKSDKHFASKTRISNLKMDPLNIKKSESVNIFTREKDPFDDDDFFNSEKSSSSMHSRPRPDQLPNTSRNTDNGDPFKWTKAFESFNFDDDK